MQWTLVIAVCSMILQAPSPIWAGEVCGDGGMICESDEVCTEHVVAMFAKDQTVALSYIVGKCNPKDQKGSDFWCGNRHCEGGFFGTPSVCCVHTPNVGATPQYSCASSELSCPGNTEQLSIRESQPNRTLRRG